MIAKCVSDDFSEETYKTFANGIMDMRQNTHIPTLATLIVVPNGLVSEWKDRFLAHTDLCVDTDILIINTKVHAQSISYQRMIDAKVVIVNANYLGGISYYYGEEISSVKRKLEWVHHSHRLAQNTLEDFSDHLETQAVLHGIYWRRIITDEINMIVDSKAAIRNTMKELKANHYWGITATPKISTTFEVAEYLHFLTPGKSESLVKQVRSSEINSKNFLDAHVRRFIKPNELVSCLPPIEEETIWLDMTKEERAFYNSLRSDICHTGLMENDFAKLSLAACSHWVLANVLKNNKDIGEMNIHTFSTLVNKQREEDIHKLNLQLESSDESESVDIRTRIRNLESQLRFFQTVMDQILYEKEQYKCCICLGQYDGGQLAISSCGHYVCKECSTYLKNECPHCRTKSRFVLTCPDNVDTKGTKMSRIIEEIQRIMREDHTNMIVVFTQYRKFANFIEKDLNQLGISASHVHGAQSHRENMIAKWSSQSPVLICTVEDSAAGLNLQKGNYIILANPLSLEHENQAIGRCHRQGQKRPVKVLRYAMKNSIEERIYKETQIAKSKRKRSRE